METPDLYTYIADIMENEFWITNGEQTIIADDGWLESIKKAEASDSEGMLFNGRISRVYLDEKGNQVPREEAGWRTSCVGDYVRCQAGPGLPKWERCPTPAWVQNLPQKST